MQLQGFFWNENRFLKEICIDFVPYILLLYFTFAYIISTI